MKIIANGPEYSSERVIAVRRTVEENPCGKRKRKGKRWRAAYSGARRSSAFQIGRPSQDFHAALRCTRPLLAGVACLTDGIQYDGISVVDRCATELCRASLERKSRRLSASDRLRHAAEEEALIFSSELTNGPDSVQRLSKDPDRRFEKDDERTYLADSGELLDAYPPQESRRRGWRRFEKKGGVSIGKDRLLVGTDVLVARATSTVRARREV